jgi:hypothetical protein
VLDAGQAVTAKQLQISTPTPGWQARVFATREAAIPPDLTGWTAASPLFTMSQATRKMTLNGPPARYFLLWITKLTGTPGKWAASVSELSLLGTSP